MYDILIKNGKIISGLGNPWYYGDIAIGNNKIIKISCFPKEITAAKIIDAKGLYIAPGFIDGHSHSDLFILTHPLAEQKIMQGITTENIGMDGMSVAPIDEINISDWKKHLSGLDGSPDIEWSWRNFSDYLNIIAQANPSDNISSYVGLGTIRLKVLGMTDRLATDDEIEKMKRIIIQSMEAGARGISAGLVYPPGSYQTSSEIIELVKTIKEYNGIFNIHIRNESNNIINSIKEVIEISKKSEVPVIITHFKIMGRENWGASEEAINLIDNSRQEGVDITLEQYPYTACSTMLHAVIPPWYHANGSEKLIQNLIEDKELIKQDIQNRLDWENYPKISGWENIYVSSIKSIGNKIFEGKSITEIASMRSISDPTDAALELLAEEELAVGMIAYCTNEKEIINIMNHPSVSFITDGLLGGKPHPRVYGTFPRILGRYVREKGIISLEEAIRKMTSLPAEKLRLRNKGKIEENFDADITIFDLENIIDRATYENPRQFSSGIEWVLVNGKIVVEKSRHTKAQPGKVIRSR